MRRVRLPRRPLTAALLLLGLAGCSGLFSDRDQQPIQTYMFTPRQFVQGAETTSNLVLLVSPVQSIGHDSRHMAYSMRPFERTFYAFNQWADTPPRMIEPLVVQAMEASGQFRAVVDGSTSSPADLRLDLDLLVLEHEFHTERSQGRMVIRGQVTDLATNAVVGTRLFEAAAPSPTENPYGGVLALNVALEQLLNELVDWMADLHD